MMNKIVTQIAVAFLMFLLGTMVAALFSSKPSRHKVKTPQSVDLKRHIQVVKEEWRQIQIGSVSFSIPSYLKKTGSPGNVGVIEAFGGPFVGQEILYVNYSYGKKVASDFNTPSGRRTDIVIDGKRATLYVREWDEEMRLNWKDRPHITLVVPDVGDGRTKFEIYAASFDVDLMKRIVGSVHIR